MEKLLNFLRVIDYRGKETKNHYIIGDFNIDISDKNVKNKW